ncbi:MAG: methyltransferase domain-containing protein [Alphaproteobacteria bacterium]|nr:methyltransferase domain-containing protein [Alphaproteobacteria bacterium]
MIWNSAFARDTLQYDASYESTQAYSETFSDFHRDLASRLVARLDLGGKHVVEIGCGQGEFLALLREEGIGRATGFDPASRVPAGDGMEIHAKPFVAADLTGDVDFLCCKMTLEHIPDPFAFLRTVHDGLSGSRDPVVFFMVPNAARILAEGAFWDIYFEHVLYFTPETLTHVFRHAGFEVCANETEYGGQYCSVIARPSPAADAEGLSESPSAGLADSADALGERVEKNIEAWASRLNTAPAGAVRTVIWGGGSKTVAFLAALYGRIEIAGVVDINPLRQGTFLPRAGNQIIAPVALREISPDRVLVMNPVYETEIRAQLADLDLRPELLVLGSETTDTRL